MATQQFKITEASIYSERFGTRFFSGAPKYYDIRAQVAEINIFESLENPYLSGSLVVLDDKALFERIEFSGTERFKMTICSTDDELTPVMERTFIMTGIERSVKSNDNGKSSMVSITLLDEHMFLSYNKQISRSFNGRIDYIIGKILTRDMNKQLDVSYLQTDKGEFSEVIQENIRGIFPNLHPHEAVKWLLERATTLTGSPFYAYASMHDENLRLGNLDIMLKQKPFNTRLPYTYNPSNVSQAESQTPLEKAFVVKNMKVAKIHNTIKLVQAGLVSSQYANTNLNTGEIFSQHYSIRNTLANLEKRDIIPPEQQNVFDTQFKLNEINFDEYDSRKFHTITSTGTYLDAKSYHDEYDENKFKKKLERLGILGHLTKNMYNVIIDGTGFMVSRATVGDLVSMKVVNDNIETSIFSSEDDTIDKEKSGNFLIYDIRHTFQGTAHTVSMNVCKLTREV